MCAGFLILSLISTLAIASAQTSSFRQTWSPFLRPPTSPKEDNSPPAHFYNPGVTTYKNGGSPFYRHNLHDYPTEPYKMKKFRETKRPKYARRPYESSTADWKTSPGKNSEYNFPSRFLEPPRLDGDYNYYAKPKKPVVSHNKKNDEEVIPKNHKLSEEDEEEEEDLREKDFHEDPSSNYVRDHAPELQEEASADVRAKDDEDSDHENVIGTPESPKDRIEFHIQGHEGPQTYIFGYDTGNGNNRQFRLEERHEDGSVTGQYGYIDARGKLRKVRYKASPSEGYIEKHHEAHEERV